MSFAIRRGVSFWLVAIGVATITVAGLAGCNRAPRWPRATERAIAIVRVDGKPIEGALVILGPLGAGYASQGVTDARGQARLTTFTQGDGAVAGRYRAIVSWEDVKPNPAVKIPDPKKDLEAFRAAMEAAIAAGHPTHLHQQRLPARYTSFETSGLEAEIRAGTVNEVVLDLTTAPQRQP
jgi:hypothetical protein